MSHLHAAFHGERTGAVGSRISLAHLSHVNETVGSEITARDQVHDVAVLLIGARHPFGAGDHPGINEVSHLGGRLLPQRTRTDVALDQRRVGGKVGLFEGGCLSGGQRRGEPSGIDLAVSRQSDHQGPGAPIRLGDLEHHVLQSVGSFPLPVSARVVRVEHLHQGCDGRGSGSIDDDGTGHVFESNSRRGRDRHGLHVCGITSGRAHEAVLPCGQHGLELFGFGTSHGPGRGLHDHVLQAETVEDTDVGVPEDLIAGLQALVVDVEGIGVLHDELTSPEQTGAGTSLITVFRLDLVQPQGQVFVGAVQVAH